MFLLECPTKNDVEELGFRDLRRRGAILERCRGSDQGLYGENSREIKKNREAEGEGMDTIKVLRLIGGLVGR